MIPAQSADAVSSCGEDRRFLIKQCSLQFQLVGIAYCAERYRLVPFYVGFFKSMESSLTQSIIRAISAAVSSAPIASEVGASVPAWNGLRRHLLSRLKWFPTIDTSVSIVGKDSR